MKKLFLIITVAATISSCNNADKTTPAGGDTSKTNNAALADAKTTIPEMPYTLMRPYKNWQTGDPRHAVTVMKGLQAFESGDIAACLNSFADSTFIAFDYYDHKLSKDSLKAFFTESRNSMSSIKVKMQDWESVIAADKTEEWVTLWYKEYVTDKKGMVDSSDVINDARIEKGKIVLLSEATRHLGPAPVKK